MGQWDGALNVKHPSCLLAALCHVSARFTRRNIYMQSIQGCDSTSTASSDCRQMFPRAKKYTHPLSGGPDFRRSTGIPVAKSNPVRHNHIPRGKAPRFCFAAMKRQSKTTVVFAQARGIGNAHLIAFNHGHSVRVTANRKTVSTADEILILGHLGFPSKYCS